jgi:hypothetical protein
MGDKDTARRKRQERETSLPPHYYYHHCYECSWFHEEYSNPESYHRNYCLKDSKTVPPDKGACGYFFFRHLEVHSRSWKTKTRPFIPKKGRCHWCGREFFYKVRRQKTVRLFCTKRHKRKYKRFWGKQESASNTYSFSLSWGMQPSAGRTSIMSIITPTRIVYFNFAKSFARYCWLFVIDGFGRCLGSAFVALND